MKLCRFSDYLVLFVIFGLLILLAFAAAPGCDAEGPSAGAVAAFNSYTSGVESRLGQQHRLADAFPASGAPRSMARLRGGELIVEEVTPSGGTALPGALLHHWRGSAFAPGATAADFERLMKNFDDYPENFSPQVIQARVISQKGDDLQTLMRVRQKHVITVVMDTAYDVTFGRLDERHGYSISRSTRISEIGSPGTGAERELSADEAHGFLWRLNTYWSYEEKDGGLYMQIETVSLTRSIPRGLGWAVQPFVESIPRESLEFTLRSTCNGLRNWREREKKLDVAVKGGTGR
jgi:hypothetical protein